MVISSRRSLIIVPNEFSHRKKKNRHKNFDFMCDRKKVRSFISISNYLMQVLIMLIKLITG